jgi:putative nucleotidyltransferase with HDIG domain
VADRVATVLAPVRASIGLDDGWLVGGAIRDALLGRSFDDWDVVVPGDAGDAARAYARRSGGSPFALSERHGTWRVVGPGLTVDFTGLVGTIADDLARRDFTVNAIAVRLDDGSIVDPHDGVGDLARRLLRPVADGAFRADPLRLLRLARLATELELEIPAEALVLARRDAHLADRPAGERTLAELGRLLAARDPADALELCDRIGVLGVVLPEVAALRGVEQSRFHHLDVFGHTLHVVDSTADIATNPDHYFPASAALVAAALAEPLDGSTTVDVGLRWAALLHDIAKPTTRTMTESGLVKFFGHEAAGVAVAETIIDRLCGSAALRRFCGVLVGQHLALGFLAKQRPLDARTVYRYAMRTRPHAIPSVLVSLGDRLATRGDLTRLRGLRRHQEVARDMVAALAALGPVPPRLLLPADELARSIGLTPGPALGELVAAVQEEQAAGVVASADDAVAFGRAWVAER